MSLFKEGNVQKCNEIVSLMIHTPRFNNKTKQLLENTLNFYFSRYQHVHNIKSSVKQNKKLEKTIHSWLKMDRNVGKPILDELEKGTYLTHSIKTPHINLQMLLEKENPKMDMTHFIIKRALVMIDLFKLTGKKPTKFTISAFPSKQKRVLSDKTNKGDTKKEIRHMIKKSTAHTTSGETFSHKNEIILTKEEELAKLVLHELVHIFDLEKDDGSIRSPNLVIYNNWCIDDSTNLSTFEAYTELLSNIFHCFSITCEMALKNNREPTIDDLIKYLEIECMYSVYLTAKLLYWYGYRVDNINTFFSKMEGCPRVFSPIPMMDYIIIRGILFFSLDKLLSSGLIEVKNGIFTFQALPGYRDMEKELVEETIMSLDYSEALKESLFSLEQEFLHEDLSMTYTCLDIDFNQDLSFIQKYLKIGQKGGQLNDKSNKWKYKYLKYKTKYLQLKTT